MYAGHAVVGMPDHIFYTQSIQSEASCGNFADSTYIGLFSTRLPMNYF